MYAFLLPLQPLLRSWQPILPADIILGWLFPPSACLKFSRAMRIWRQGRWDSGKLVQSIGAQRSWGGPVGWGSNPSVLWLSSLSLESRCLSGHPRTKSTPHKPSQKPASLALEPISCTHSGPIKPARQPSHSHYTALPSPGCSLHSGASELRGGGGSGCAVLYRLAPVGEEGEVVTVILCDLHWNAQQWGQLGGKGFSSSPPSLPWWCPPQRERGPGLPQKLELPPSLAAHAPTKPCHSACPWRIFVSGTAWVFVLALLFFFALFFACEGFNISHKHSPFFGGGGVASLQRVGLGRVTCKGVKWLWEHFLCNFLKRKESKHERGGARLCPFGLCPSWVESQWGPQKYFTRSPPWLSVAPSGWAESK